MTMNFRLPQKSGDFLASWTTISMSKEWDVMFHRISRSFFFGSKPTALFCARYIFFSCILFGVSPGFWRHRVFQGQYICKAISSI
jgi:hypothetical protein